jgi:AcrR family transcriptional regulator
MTDSPEATPRQRNARGEGDRLRVDLLDAAAELLAEHGNVAEVSLRKVARQAGVSPTAVYRHFDDHDELLHEAIRFCWQNFHDALREARDSTDDPFRRLLAAGQAYVRFAFGAPGQYGVLFGNSLDMDVDDPDSPGMAAFEILIGLVTDILDANGDDRDPFFVAVQVHTWIHGMVHLCSTTQIAAWPAMDDLLDGCVDALRLVPRPA